MSATTANRTLWFHHHGGYMLAMRDGSPVVWHDRLQAEQAGGHVYETVGIEAPPDDIKTFARRLAAYPTLRTLTMLPEHAVSLWASEPAVEKAVRAIQDPPPPDERPFYW